ncbi:alpha/beta fold hydrolase [Dictyobacter arantiisoli]|uniref:Hydrolase n=1 Tax=Dictyobacter arantiisoli TaxID=2014874 RepID=A0A5A5TFL2_9CHLR|nr:alpha/beta hydrolase [Dictyobacter arantiisoli]GCF10028.1 hydrolase [Dictyobacter arantiisoli]
MKTEQKETGFLGHEGARLYYETAGTGYPLLLIHAGIADSRMWDEQVAVFAEQYRVIRYDLRGYGATEVPAGPISNHADAANLLRHLHVEKAHVLGISFGGLVALDFSLAYPELVASLILVAPSVSGQKPSESELQFSDEENAYLEKGDLAGATELNLRMWVDGPQRTPEQVAPAVRERVHQMQMHAFNIPMPEEAEGIPLTPPAILRLNEIHVPTLLMVGDLDIPARLALVDELASAISGAQQVLISGVAHMVSMEKPEEFNRLVLHFLGQLAGSDLTRTTN